MGEAAHARTGACLCEGDRKPGRGAGMWHWGLNRGLEALCPEAVMVAEAWVYSGS